MKKYICDLCGNEFLTSTLKCLVACYVTSIKLAILFCDGNIGRDLSVCCLSIVKIGLNGEISLKLLFHCCDVALLKLRKNYCFDVNNLCICSSDSSCSIAVSAP